MVVHCCKLILQTGVNNTQERASKRHRVIMQEGTLEINVCSTEAHA